MNELQRFCQWYDEALLMALLGHRLTVGETIQISADTDDLKKKFMGPNLPEEIQKIITSTCTWDGQEVMISYQKSGGWSGGHQLEHCFIMPFLNSHFLAVHWALARWMENNQELGQKLGMDRNIIFKPDWPQHDTPSVRWNCMLNYLIFNVGKDLAEVAIVPADEFEYLNIQPLPNMRYFCFIKDHILQFNDSVGHLGRYDTHQQWQPAQEFKLTDEHSILMAFARLKEVAMSNLLWHYISKPGDDWLNSSTFFDEYRVWSGNDWSVLSTPPTL